MTAADASFELSEAEELAPPPIRRGTVAKSDVMARLEEADCPLAIGRRTRRLRQDDTPGPLGRGRSTAVRVGCARRTRRRPRGVPAVHRRRDPPHPAAARRCLRRPVRPGGHDLDPARPAPRPRARHAGAALRARAGRPARDRRIPTASTCCPRVLGHVPAGSRLAIASREEPALPIARWRAHGHLQEIGVSETAPRRSRGRPAPGRGRGEAGFAGALRADRPDGGLAGGAVPRGAVAAGGGPSPASAGASPAITGTSPSTSDRGAGRLPPRTGSSSSRRRCWSAYGDLCDTALEITGSAGMLERICARTASSCPRRRGEWYRYHHLFRVCCTTSLTAPSRTSYAHSTLVR